jgi:hypothetical protein
MPAGPGLVGFIAFAGVKYAGYTLAALVLKKAFRSPDTNIFKVGLARTGIGLGAGALFGGISILLATSFLRHSTGDLGTLLFFALLIPVRIAEWCLLIHLFFDKGLVDRNRDTKYAALGVIWSFVLDAVGIFAALVVPGGFWIC